MIITTKDVENVIREVANKLSSFSLDQVYDAIDKTFGCPADCPDPYEVIKAMEDIVVARCECGEPLYGFRTADEEMDDYSEDDSTPDDEFSGDRDLAIGELDDEIGYTDNHGENGRTADEEMDDYDFSMKERHGR